jgi:uncharacterized protein YdhG (YjbR/CyaY superfamily)
MSVIDDYVAQYSGPEKVALENIRSIVQTTVPDAEEVITYSMPGFKYKGNYLIAFSIFKDHIGLFPTSGPIESLKEKLADFKTSKGGIQFTAQKPLPDSLIKEILLIRVSEIDNK